MSEILEKNYCFFEIFKADFFKVKIVFNLIELNRTDLFLSDWLGSNFVKNYAKPNQTILIGSVSFLP